MKELSMNLVYGKHSVKASVLQNSDLFFKAYKRH